MRVSSVHGRMIMILSGVFALMAALGHQAPPAIAALLAMGAGACEWHGATTLHTGRGTGIAWMATGELLLLLIVAAYSLWMMQHFDLAQFRAQMPAELLDEIEADWVARGLEPSEFPDLYRFFNLLSYGLVMLVSTLYQGGFALYYLSKRKPVAVALEQLRQG